MPTFDTPNSQSTYTVPSGIFRIDVTVRGGPGGPSNSATATPGDAGEVSFSLDVSGGEDYDVIVGERGGDQTLGSGGAGGQSPLGNGGDGGGGGQYDDGSTVYLGAGGGGGGAASGLVRVSDSASIAIAEGGGGNGGDGGSDHVGGGGGGGGSRGGVGGAGGNGTQSDGVTGQAADGSGTGGDGGDGGDEGQDGSDGADGGTHVHQDADNVSTATSSNDPVVEITEYQTTETYNTPNSQHTYIVPNGAGGLEIVDCIGGDGGQGGTGNFGGNPGGAGGTAGQVQGRLVASPGDVFTINVGEDGEGGGSGSVGGGSGGQSPNNSAGGGGGGHDTAAGGGGGGGAESSVVRDADGALIAVGEGGGGGEGGHADNEDAGGGGGGGARGGLGGDGGFNDDGGDATGTGDGGDGGGDGSGSPAQDGFDGGTQAHGDLQNVSTSTSTAGPLVQIEVGYPPAAPQSLTVDGERDTEIDISWTDDDSQSETSTEDGYRVYVDDGSGETQVADLAADTESYTITGLLHGEQYDIRVEAYNAFGTADDTTTGTTTIPDVGSPTLDNSDEDEITASWSDVLNNGDYRVQIRETGETSWDGSAVGFDEQVVDESTTSVIFGGLEDGEEYEVRTRTETAHRTGSWPSAPATITQFPSPENLQVDSRAGTVQLSYDDRADNEDSVELQRSTDGGSTWTTVATYGPNTESVEDANPPYYEVLAYRVKQFTDHSEGTSNVITTAAARSDDGIWAEIWKEPDGDPLGDQILQGAIDPDAITAVEQLELEHTAISGWAISTAPANTDIRDFHLGDVAIYSGDELLIRGPLQRTPRQRETLTLEGVGPGHLLRTDTTRESYQNERVHTAIQDYVSNLPSEVTWTVVEPTVEDIQSGKTIIDTSVGDTFDALFAGNVADDEPVIFDASNDEVQLAPICWFQEAEDATLVGPSVVGDSDTFSMQDAARFNQQSHELDWTFTPDHDVPSDDVGWAFRYKTDSHTGNFQLFIDGQMVFERVHSSDTRSIEWLTTITTFDDPPDLQAGQTYTVNVKTVDGGGGVSGNLDLDCLCVFDQGDRHGGFSFTFDNSVDNISTLDGPELVPEEWTIRAEEPGEVFHVNRVALSSTWDDTSNSQGVGVAADGMDGTFVSASNTDSIDVDFDAQSIYGAVPAVELTLSRFYSGDAVTPTSGDTSQTVSELSVDIDLDDLPIIGSEGITLDAATWLENLQNLHERGNFRFTIDHRQADLTAESYRTGDPKVIQTDDWTTVGGLDAVTNERDTSEYYNEVRVFADPDSGINPLVTRFSQAEVDRVNAIERRAIMSGAETLAERREASREALLEGVAGDQQSGTIQIHPTWVAPGYPYQPSEFDGETSNLERVSLSKAVDGVSGRLSFGARRDIVSTIQERTR